MIRESGASGMVEWAASGRPISCASVSGDQFVVAPYAGGVVLGVIDGLGHGDEAAKASELAAAVIAGQSALALKELVESCHAALRQTRGVVLTLARIDSSSGQLSWLGVGNVEAVLYSARGRTGPVTRPGVVGFRLPSLRTTTERISRGDILVFASDGVASDFLQERPTESLADYATALVERFGKQTDDVLVLAARYIGAPP